MIIYFILAFIAAILTIIAERKYQIILCSFIILMMFLVCGLRGMNVGIDTKDYIDSFRYGVENYFLDSNEKLFNITYSIVHVFSSSWNIWLLFVSTLIYIPLFIILKNESPNPLFSSLIFMVSMSHFFPESMNIIRQSIATTFILGSYSFWNKDKKILSLIVLLIAILFHTTSIIALPFLFLKKIRFNNNLIFISLFIVTLLGIIGFYGFINNYILSLSELNDNIYAATMLKYSKYGIGMGSNLNGYIFAIIPFSVLCLITMPISEQDNKYRFYFNIMFVATVLYSLISSIDYAFRIVYGLMITQILVIPYAYKFGKPNRRKLIIIYTFVMIIFYFWYINTMNKIHIGSIVPYQFFGV